MRKVFIILPFACLASYARGADTCQDCASAGKSSLLQKTTLRDKRNDALAEDSLDEAMREVPLDGDAEHSKEIAALQKSAADGVASSTFLGQCDICSQKTEAGNWELIPNRWAGRVNAPGDPDSENTVLWRCKDADRYMDYVTRFRPCPEPPSLWLRRCCQSGPTPRPTPTPTPAPTPMPSRQQLDLPAGHCDICPGSSVLFHYYAAKDKNGLYNCARANRFANRDGPRKPTCQRAKTWWSRWCCANKQLKCSICPRGKRDVKKWITAGKWKGRGAYLNKWVTCKRAEALLQQPHAPQCALGRRPFVNTCCFSRR